MNIHMVLLSMNIFLTSFYIYYSTWYNIVWPFKLISTHQNKDILDTENV